jgi:ketosteroid isomerase-like protein
VTHDHVQAWLDRYVRAWETYDAAEIRGLFSEDAEYRYRPWDDPEKGLDTIVDSWLNPGGPASQRDQPGTWKAHYEPYVVEGERAVAIGETSYYSDATQQTLERHYFNIWQLEFDADGRCRSFVEWFMQRKKPAA